MYDPLRYMVYAPAVFSRRKLAITYRVAAENVSEHHLGVSLV